MLQHLTHSKHKTISQCSAGALKNLYAAKPSGMLDMVSKGANYGMPSLQLRKRRNMVSCKKKGKIKKPQKCQNCFKKGKKL